MTASPPIRRSRPSRFDRPVPRRTLDPGAAARSAARAPAIAVALALAVAAVTACGRSAPADPDVDGLLVATGGPLRITDAAGALEAFDSPIEPVVAVTAAAGVVVAIDGSGRAAISDGAAPDRGWRALDLPDPDGAVHLAALGPGAKALVVAAGEPQASFALTFLDLAGGATTRSIAVAPGLNGPPSWLGPDTIAIDVVGGDGSSRLVTVEVASGELTDHPGPATIAAASADGAVLALDEGTTGDVLVGDAAAWRAGDLETMTRLHGPPTSGVGGLALSADGTRLAIARRSDDGGSLELLVHRAGGWTTVRTLTLPGDAPISVAWRG